MKDIIKNHKVMFQVSWLKFHGKNGFTLIEILVVIVLLAIIVTMTLADFYLLKKRTDLSNDIQEIGATIKLAQSRTRASENNSQHGVYFDSANSKYVLYKGATYAARDVSADRVSFLSSTVNFNAISLGGGSEVTFEKLTGIATQCLSSCTVVLQLTSDASQIKTIYVSSYGIISYGALSPSDSNRVKDSRHIQFDYSRVIATSSENLVLNFNNGELVQSFPLGSYASSGQIDLQDTVTVGGVDQVFEIHTHRLNSPDTQFSIHRDRRFNTVPLTITLSGDSSGNLIQYSADGATITNSSIYVSNLVWQ